MKTDLQGATATLERAMGELDRTVLRVILFNERRELDKALDRVADAGVTAASCGDRAPVEKAIKRVHSILAHHRTMADPQRRANQIDDFPIGAPIV